MNLINKDQSPRIEELDERDPNWHHRYDQPRGLFVENWKLVVYVVICLVLLGTFFYKNAEASHALINCMSLVDASGEE